MFENKKKFALWMYPATYEKLEAIYREDNCESRSEFVEKAVNFYIGYLTSEDKTSYLQYRETVAGYAPHTDRDPR